MSITGIHPESTTEKMSKKIIQWRKNSGEIDVFEAAKYFSGANEEYYSGYNNKQSLRGGRKSFDMPMMRNSSSLLPSQTTYHHHIMDQKPTIIKKDQKKYKQPSSPGGRLASFLNSLFNQTSSKKKKSSQSLKDEDDQSPSGRRKRRSSISHFSFRSSSNIITTTNTNTTNSSSSDSKSSLNSGFRTPPPYAPTPTKSYKDFKSFGLGKQQHEVYGDKKNATDNSWLDEKLKLSKNNGVYYSDKYKNTSNGLLLSEKTKTYNRVVVDDDDGDSDSSSDLFDLPNIDLDYYSSSGLPVYETTHMDNIKRGAPISTGAI
ncbi:protein BIG GRAIN 1-like E [Lycium ferocissimum]|uniref:protein BIG GRAIN 1-like E n=1 Tax=Lycium ferocissimum TaxID=112874 RepID=UPI0028156634|nr:protein BIG GRAIN 1-like E [Lycium ferocissimum]